MLLLPAPKEMKLLPSGECKLLPAPRTIHVVSIGGGLSSTYKLIRRVIQKYGKENCIFIFAYLPNEHPDMLDLIFEVERYFGINILFIGLRRTPMEQFMISQFLGNSRTDPCSAILKRNVVLEWLKAHCDPARTVLHVGVTYHEVERMIKIRLHWNNSGWQVEADLANDPTITRASLIAECKALFGWVPTLYLLGFEHHNCHGACVKAGQYQWAMLLWHFPGIYAEWEAGEKLFREIHGNYTILTRGRGKNKRQLTLEAFRLELQLKWANLLPGFDPFDGLEENPACLHCAAV